MKGLLRNKRLEYLTLKTSKSKHSTSVQHYSGNTKVDLGLHKYHPASKVISRKNTNRLEEYSGEIRGHTLFICLASKLANKIRNEKETKLFKLTIKGPSHLKNKGVFKRFYSGGPQLEEEDMQMDPEYQTRLHH